MTYTEGAAFWNSLPESEKQRFYNIAAKESSNHTAFEWFMHLVPDELKDDPDKMAVFMDGGTVVTEEVLYDQGRAGATTQQVEHELPDRDVSRIESGHNGGDYTTENTIMEDASINRSRGAEDMSPEELTTAQADNASSVELLEQGEILTTDTSLLEAVEPSLAEELLGGALEAVVPAIFAVKAAQVVASEFDTVEDKLGFGALSAGGTILLFTNPITGPLAWTGAGLYSAYKLGQIMLRMGENWYRA